MKTLQSELCRAGLAMPEKSNKQFFLLQEPALMYLEEVKERAELVRRSKSIKPKKIEPKKLKNGRTVFMIPTDLKIMGSKGYKVLELIRLYKEVDLKTVKDSINISRTMLGRFMKSVIDKGFVEKEEKPGRIVIYKWNTSLPSLDVYKQSAGFLEKEKEIPEKQLSLEGRIGERIGRALENLEVNINISGKIEFVFKFEIGK